MEDSLVITFLKNWAKQNGWWGCTSPNAYSRSDNSRVTEVIQLERFLQKQTWGCACAIHKCAQYNQPWTKETLTQGPSQTQRCGSLSVWETKEMSSDLQQKNPFTITRADGAYYSRHSQCFLSQRLLTCIQLWSHHFLISVGSTSSRCLQAFTAAG